MDKYEDDPGQPTKDKPVYMYGQVLFYTYVTLWAHRNLGINTDISEIIAIISLCRTLQTGEDTDASRSLVWYKNDDMESIRVFNAKAIDGVIGCVKVGNRWGIVDRCWGLQGAIMEGMVDPDYESEDDPNE